MKHQILVQYDNSDDAMYGNGTDLDGIDCPASEANFEKQLKKAIKKHFPKSNITIETGYGRYSVDGNTDTVEAETIGEIVNQVWSTFDWVIER